MKLRRSFVAPAAVLVVAVLTGGWFLQQGVSQEQNVYMQVRLLQEVVDHVENRYVDPVQRDSLYQAAIKGVIRDLEDPNTSFLDATEYESLRIRTEGEYGGVGLEITERNGWVTVVTALPGTPGTRAGIRAGDRIVRVKGESAEGWTVNQVVEELRGEPDTNVELRVQRPGVPDPIPFTVTRAKIELRSVPFVTMLDDGVGYVPLQVVSESSAREVRSAVDSLESEGMQGLILDLRGNPGGLLDQGIAISDLFLDAEQVVVETRGRAPGQDEVMRAGSAQAYGRLPVVVLVDAGSASASEIVAGALQDHDRGLVIGSPTFGKGSVQTLYRLAGGNVLKLTTARWYTPVGRSIQRPFGEDSPEDLDASSSAGVLTLAGTQLSRPDTAGRPTFLTDAGRTVYGGGGITPDLLVLPDTLRSREKEAVREIFRNAGTFMTTRFNFAVQYLQDHPDLQRGFELGPSDLDAFYQRLTDADVSLERDEFDRAERFVRYQLVQEIANQAWGQEGEFRQLMGGDDQVQRAVELLGRASSPGALFRVADVQLPEETGDEGEGGDGR